MSPAPFVPDTYIAGLDVSYYQPEVNFQEVSRDPLDPKFVVVKATEGNGWVSKSFKKQWQGARDQFFRSGGEFFRSPYHFCRWETPGDPKLDAEDEAAHFFETVGELGEGDLPPVADMEWITDSEGKAFKRDPDELVAWARYFLESLELLFSRLPWLYIGPAFWRYCLLPDKKDLSLELASWPRYVVDYNHPAGKPAVMKDSPRWDWVLHQFSSKGIVQGVYDKFMRPTKVDLNRFHGSMDELKLLAMCG